MKSRFFDELIKRHPELECCGAAIEHAADIISSAFGQGGRLFICGNGGSAADALHIAGELCKGFLSRRPLSDEFKALLRAGGCTLDDRALSALQWGLPAIPLTGSDALFTAFINDVDAELVFAQQLFALGSSGDALLAISTSGNSKNVAAAASLARGMGIAVVALTGHDGGRLGDLSDAAIKVPATETPHVQELHLPVYHALCAALEENFEVNGWSKIKKR